MCVCVHTDCVFFFSEAKRRHLFSHYVVCAINKEEEEEEEEVEEEEAAFVFLTRHMENREANHRAWNNVSCCMRCKTERMRDSHASKSLFSKTRLVFLGRGKGA